MTCIVAIIDGNCVVMGSDSASVEGENMSVRAGSSKSWSCYVGKEEILVGFAGNFAEGNFIRYAFEWPKRKKGQEVAEWLVADVQPNIQKCLKERFEDRKDVPIEWVLLIGVKPGRLFVLSQCGDVQEALAPYAAIGAGFSTALGCLETLDLESSSLLSWERVEMALKVSEKFHSSVRGPMNLHALA